MVFFIVLSLIVIGAIICLKLLTKDDRENQIKYEYKKPINREIYIPKPSPPAPYKPKPSTPPKPNKSEQIGKEGEYLIQNVLKNISGYSYYLSNIYVPYRGKTSEIDVLLIHEKGIFVIESKNYSGWIFGNESYTNWTQCLKGGNKNQFYNPISQNKTHINALSNYLRLNRDCFVSYIVFSERCELKAIPANYNIMKRNELLHYLSNDLNSREILFSNEQILNICKELYPLTQVTEQQKQEHIAKIMQ